MSLGGNIRSGARWLVVGSLGSQVLSFIFGIVLARLLTPEDFGAIVTLQVFTGFASYLAGGGMGEALVQSKDIKEAYYRVIFLVQLCIGVLIFSFFYYFAILFGEWYGNPMYTDLMRVSAITFFMRPFASIAMVQLRRNMRFREISMVNMAVLVVSGAVSISLAMHGWGAWSLVLGGIAGGVFRISLLGWVVRWIPRVQFDLSIIKRFSVYGFKATANELLVYLHRQAGNLVISLVGNAATVGLFNKADSVKGIPLLAIGHSVYQPVFRALASEQDDKSKSTYLYTRSIILLTLYMLPIYTGIYWVADSFIINLYGDKWAEAVAPLEILVFCGVFFCVGSPSGAVVAARNRLGRELIVGVVNLLLISTSAYVGYTYYGIVGIAWGLLFVEINSSFWISRIATTSLGVSHFLAYKALLPGLFLNGIMFFSLFLFDKFLVGLMEVSGSSGVYLIGMTIVGCIVYGSAFLFLPIPSFKSEAERWKKGLGLC